MESVVAIVFDVEAEAYQAMTSLRQNPVSKQRVISQAALVKKVDGHLETKDGFDTGMETSDDTALGGMIGGLVGIIGGPIGILVSGGIGALTGSVADSIDADRNVSLIEKVAETLADGSVAILALAQENEPDALSVELEQYQRNIQRWDATEVADEVAQAKELEMQLAREAKQKLRAEKKAERKQAMEEHRAKLKADFDAFRESFKK